MNRQSGASVGWPEVIENALGTAAWPDGEPFIRLAAAHRRRVAEYVAAALRDAGWLVVRNGEHLLHQEQDRWAMEHTVECREVHGVYRCPLNELACAGAWEGFDPGTYRIVDRPGESVRLERLP
jgi:hypothetical protein